MSNLPAYAFGSLCIIGLIAAYVIMRQSQRETWDVVNRCQLTADIACHERDVARDNAIKAEASREWYKTALEQTSAELERVRAELEKTKTDRDEWKLRFDVLAD